MMSPDLADARFTRPQSGLVGQVVNGMGDVVWQSPSALGLTLPVPQRMDVDQGRFMRVTIGQQQWFSYSYGIAWIDRRDKEHRYSFNVLESPAIYNQQTKSFRRTLVTWLAAAALVLLVLQGIVLRWSLRPLRQIEAEVKQIESDERDQLSDNFPDELKRLASSLNLLIANERRHLERYRNSLADLAHSMKTPLAVLRGLVSSNDDRQAMKAVIDSEVSRMDDIVEYQLQRAAAAGSTTLTAGIDVLPVVDSLLSSLRKVYSDSDISYVVESDAGASFRGDKGDLMEVLGNLLDNASKWCQSKVHLGVFTQEKGKSGKAGLTLTIEDDGPGMDPQQVEILLQRGSRGDSMVPGHGIGLAIVRDIVESYGGNISIGKSSLGGAKVKIEFRS
jgi:two-component system sensor histidine kinase PhoQ